MATPGQPGAAELADIQGGLIGFNKPHQRLIYYSFGGVAAQAKAFVAAVRPMISTGMDVLDFNKAYSEAVSKPGGPPNSLQSTWTNLWLSQSGLVALGADVSSLGDAFTQGMGDRGIGDLGPSAPGTWVAPFTGGAVPDAVIVVAADTKARVQTQFAHIEAAVAMSGCTRLDNPQDGASLSNGEEHFGFKDGISQPGMKGLTQARRDPEDTIAAGEFLIGYKNEQGETSGEPASTRTSPPSQYNPTLTPPLPAPMPPWTRNGSFVVYRRLRQDVGAFREATRKPPKGLTEAALRAKLVGRWPSGAPMERVRGESAKIDPSTKDPVSADPHVTDPAHINAFDYSQDPDGA